ADLAGAEAERLGQLQGAADGGDDGRLQAVEHPGDAEGADEQPVETAPRQPVEPGRDVGLDGTLLRRESAVVGAGVVAHRGLWPSCGRGAKARSAGAGFTLTRHGRSGPGKEFRRGPPVRSTASSPGPGPARRSAPAPG